MKKLKVSLAMLAVILGIGASFASQPMAVKTAQGSTDYFAVQTTAGHWTWETSKPAGVTCQSGTATCEISTTIPGTPPDDGFPSSYSVKSGNDKASVLR